MATSGCCEITIRVIPRARRNEVVGERNGVLTVKLAAPPVKGAANKALVTCLAEMLGVPARDVTILGGETARSKRLRIDGLDEAAVRRLLQREE